MFPFVNTFVTVADVDKAWQELVHLQPNYELSNDTKTVANLSDTDLSLRFHATTTDQWLYCVVPTSQRDYYKYDFLTDCFTENERTTARRFDEAISPQQYFLTCKEHEEAVEEDPLLKKQLREKIYRQTVEISNFPLKVAVSVYDMFRPRRVLDLHAGFGDRCIAAMARSSFISHYEACQPHAATFEAIQCAIAKLQDDHNQTVKVWNLNFRNFVAARPPIYYDLIFTSPPCPGIMVRDVDEQQADDADIRDDAELLRGFVRAWTYLSYGGRMVVNINNVRSRREEDAQDEMKFNATEKFVHDISTMCSGNKYLGVILFGHDNNSLQPMFIWEKVKLEGNFKPRRQRNHANNTQPIKRRR